MTVDLSVEQAILAEARTEVSYADTKAAILFAALGVGFGAFLGGVVASDWAPTDLDGVAELFWWLGAASLLAATVLAGLAIWPRLGSASASGTIYYWGDVATCTSESEMRLRFDESPASELDRTRSQIWALSRIVNKKHRMVQRSMGVTALSSALFLVAGVLILV